MTHDFFGWQAIIFNLACLLTLALEFWLEARDHDVAASNQDRKTASLINIFTALALLIGYLAYYNNLWPMLESEKIRFVSSLVLVWSGLFLRFWATRSLGVFFRSVVIVEPGQKIVSSGPYKYIRHPSYSAALMVIGGLILAWNSWLGLAALILVLIAYARRIKVEEKVLVESFGSDYAAYREHTKKLVPFIY